jgi:hypothetical protein
MRLNLPGPSLGPSLGGKCNSNIRHAYEIRYSNLCILSKQQATKNFLLLDAVLREHHCREVCIICLGFPGPDMAHAREADRAICSQEKNPSDAQGGEYGIHPSKDSVLCVQRIRGAAEHERDCS